MTDLTFDITPETILAPFKEFKTGHVLGNKTFTSLEGVGLYGGLPFGDPSVNPASVVPVRDFALVDIDIEHAQKWGGRWHQIQNGLALRHRTYYVHQEHALYFGCARRAHPTDVLLIQGGWGRNLGGQDIQNANRAFETLPEFAEGWGPLVYVKDRWAANTAVPHDPDNYRGSYALSFHAPDLHKAGDKLGLLMVPVIVQGYTLDNTMQATSKGCLLIEGRPWAQVKGSSFRANGTHKDGILGGQSFVLTAGIHQPNGKGGLLVVGSHFNVEDDDDYNRWNIEDVHPLTIKGCTGNTKVYRDGKYLGRVSEVTIEEH